MSSSEVVGSEKIYHFISDPDHKENLSGRVRAACMNCRRKKIKCSGEINCRTCQERGLICEGPPERKRPGRSIDLSVGPESFKARQESLSSCSKSSASSRQQSFSNSSVFDRRRSSSRRPVSALVTKDSNDSSDSGYFSPRLETPTSLHPAITSYDNAGCVNSPTAMPSDWNFVKGPTSAAYLQAEPSDIDQREMSPGRNSDQGLWWSQQSQQSGFTDLMSTASLLEEQAQSLRRLAFHQRYEDVSPETMSTSLPSRSAHRQDIMPSIQTQAPIDDLSLLNGVTQMDGSYPGWWGGNSTSPAMQYHSGSYSQSPQQITMQQNMCSQSPTWPTANLHAQRTNSGSPSSLSDRRQSRPEGTGRHQSTPNQSTMYSWTSS